MAASVEEAECDQVVGVVEAVGDAGEEPDLGVHALGEAVGEAVHDRRDDPGAVVFDPVVELHERWDLATTSPSEPVVEHPDRRFAAVLEHETEVFLQQVGAVELLVVFRDPGELGLLALDRKSVV